MHQPSPSSPFEISRRRFLAASCAAATSAAWLPTHALAKPTQPRVARIAITLDLEMSRHFPNWDDTHWDYEKGNLDEPTKRYAVEAARRVKEHGGRIHFFALGRTMEQPDVNWLRGIAAAGHPIGNHTYDHVNVRATKPEDIQFRFARSPWLIAGREPLQVIADNIRLGEVALRERAGIAVDGFRTPGGFHDGLAEHADLQQLLLSQGYRWISSKYPAHPTTMPGEPVTEDVFAGIVAAQAAAQPFVYPSGLVEIPMSPISDVGALRSARWKLEDFLTAIRRAVTWTIENGAVFDFLAHPSCLVVADPEYRAIELICEIVAKSPERAQLVTLSSLAHELQPEIPPAKS
jgi:peptidoglycan/xylan/chitin deacetylase (PgdA/CDA1 family)